MNKQTPLNSAHRQLGAKIVDFAGWDMPLHYGSQIEEHHYVRRDAGMFDVSHMLAVDIEGPGAAPLLRLLLANNIDKLQQTGQALYSCMLNPQGGVIDDLIVYFFRADFYRLVVNAGTADKDLAWITQYANDVKSTINAATKTVTIKPRRDLAIIAVQGPNALVKTWQALNGSEAASSALKPFSAAWCDDVMIARTGYTGEDGFELILPATQAEKTWNALLEAGVKPVGLGARDTLRLEAGMNLYGQDMDETVSPIESGLAWTIALDSARDFIGKAALPSSPKQKMVGLVLLDKGVLRAHQKVFTAQNEQGEITSGSFSPTMNQSIALARVPVQVAYGDTLDVEIRDKRLKARVVKPPFVRNGKILA